MIFLALLSIIIASQRSSVDHKGWSFNCSSGSSAPKWKKTYSADFVSFLKTSYGGQHFFHFGIENREGDVTVHGCLYKDKMMMLITFLAMIFEVVFLGEQMISFDDLYVGFGDHWLCNRCSILTALPGAFGKLQLLLILWTWVDFEPWRHFPVLVLDEGLQGQGGRSKVVDQEIGNPMEWKIYQFEYINFILLISPGWWVEPWGNYLLWNMRQRDGAAFDLQTSHPSDLDQPCIVKRWRKHKPQHQ